MTGPRWSLTLYVGGASPKSTQAIAAVRAVCDVDLVDQVELTIVDAYEHPELLVQDQIVAVPTLVKHLPLPRRYVVGHLSAVDAVRSALELPVPIAKDDPPGTAP